MHLETALADILANLEWQNFLLEVIDYRMQLLEAVQTKAEEAAINGLRTKLAASQKSLSAAVKTASATLPAMPAP